MSLTTIATIDLVAPLWLVACWVGYTLVADRPSGRPSLMTRMHQWRVVWMRSMLARDNRMVDVQIIGNLMRSVSFFASTSMFVIAGLVAILGARSEAMAVLGELPFAVDSPPLLWDMKVLLLIVVFVYAFFKFTWAYRHYNYCLILLGSVGPVTAIDARDEETAERAARIATSTARHFNHGIRAYYFGLATLSWFVHPWLFILLTAWVVLVLWRREFRSRLLRTLGEPRVPDGRTPS
ncbi:MAG TPA: DUF599 domain-containing protein [Geminicoccaceae bacterium]